MRLKMFKEFVENQDHLIDAKMSELKDLISSVSDGHHVIYEWENNDDHVLIINFIYDESSIRWEFDIDDLLITKIIDDEVVFSDLLGSIDEALEIIEKDIYMILGVSESKKGRTKSGRKATKVYQKKFGKNEGYKDRFSLTDKYHELPDDLIFPKTNVYEKWLEETPTHIKLLSMLCGMIDAEIADSFEFDDRFFSALENEYRYTKFRLTNEEVIEACYKLKEEGYLE